LLKSLISPYMIKDDHIAVQNEKDYTVKSIYFDTINLDEYQNKIAGVYSRKKIRIRGYIPHDVNDTIFLEIKRKINMGQIKYRSPVKYSRISELFNTSNFTEFILQRNDFPDALINATYFLYYIKRYNMLPIVLVMYEREAYIYKFDHSLRITFDKNLRSVPYPSLNNIYSDESNNYIFRDSFILEVKSNYGFPKWMMPIINKIDVKREALSKYTLCIDKNINLLNTFSKSQVIANSKLFNNNLT
jgi:SPX domain protein involved in polyphosphate accumulation